MQDILSTSLQITKETFMENMENGNGDPGNVLSIAKRAVKRNDCYNAPHYPKGLFSKDYLSLLINSVISGDYFGSILQKQAAQFIYRALLKDSRYDTNDLITQFPDILSQFLSRMEEIETMFSPEGGDEASNNAKLIMSLYYRIIGHISSNDLQNFFAFVSTFVPDKVKAWTLEHKRYYADFLQSILSLQELQSLDDLLSHSQISPEQYQQAIEFLTFIANEVHSFLIELLEMYKETPFARTSASSDITLPVGIQPKDIIKSIKSVCNCFQECMFISNIVNQYREIDIFAEFFNTLLNITEVYPASFPLAFQFLNSLPDVKYQVDISAFTAGISYSLEETRVHTRESINVSETGLKILAMLCQNDIYFAETYECLVTNKDILKRAIDVQEQGLNIWLSNIYSAIAHKQPDSEIIDENAIDTCISLLYDDDEENLSTCHRFFIDYIRFLQAKDPERIEYIAENIREQVESIASNSDFSADVMNLATELLELLP